ncbi:glycoside hydrolase family 3 N-terminal domain-containing protein [Nitratireductor sp. ZSWI3]|uniref:glycoside hydrolase family 3 N-terminal domain-containing protein n=1 Tax=Nitratireductor sp. ZSWI3 TaxID=2966359 RepID=UPI0021501F43|nr:glycoside hydrolase family 3 N-terminal domain-containing protein [Nitratireductor sp. ZSWI3]MCR4265818.1 glycoside hydrolase family 3 protein [Nitratireductor sp. ZSWI3]
MTTLRQDAYAVMLPAFDTLELSPPVRGFLKSGGCSILLGESREEYVNRSMSADRIARETGRDFKNVTDTARDLAGQDILVAIDQEMGGICRLHKLVPQFPASTDISSTPASQIEAITREIAECARSIGINLFLSPVLDMITGTNPWLENRTWSTDPAKVGTLSAAYIRGAQAGGVACTAKHFPGFHNVTGDPAITADVVAPDAAGAYEAGFGPFVDAVEAGVEVIMVGPAPVEAFDPGEPASVSPRIMNMLRRDIGFSGLILADDLDSAATMQNGRRSVPQVAVDALANGSQFLLLAAHNDMSEIADAILKAVDDQIIAEAHLRGAAHRIRALVGKYSA